MKVFLSVEQIKLSLPFLTSLNPFFGMSFLAFKKADIPVGRTSNLVFSRIVQEVLMRHYKPAAVYAGFYNPFKTSDPSDRWQRPRYGSTTLQRITTDTFSDALIHTKKGSSWGWRAEYIKRLQAHLGKHRISAFHLSVWLFRDSEWPSTVSPEDVAGKLYSEYSLTKDEIHALFDRTIPETANPWLSEKPVSEGDLLALIGSPSGWAPPAGAALRSLEMREVGPAKSLRYEPAERLNIITGNNSLGKTFLLECLWWALTGDWLDYAAQPREDASKRHSRITFCLSSPSGRAQDSSASFNWDRQAWEVSPPTSRLAGLVIYARYDGSFAIWDPARSQLAQQHSRMKTTGQIFLTRSQVWHGTLDEATKGGERWVCNGLLRDWISWQTNRCACPLG